MKKILSSLSLVAFLVTASSVFANDPAAAKKEVAPVAKANTEKKVEEKAATKTEAKVEKTEAKADVKVEKTEKKAEEKTAKKEKKVAKKTVAKKEAAPVKEEVKKDDHKGHAEHK